MTGGSDGQPTINGQPADGGPEMGPQTGWSPRFGWPVESVMEGESLLDHQTWLEGKMPDKYYGGESRRQRFCLALKFRSADYEISRLVL